MEYMNIPTALFSSPEFIGAEPIQRATWIALLAWCCTQENGGIIEGCRSWGMRRWMQTCGVMDKEVMNGGELYHFDGDNLVVFGYPGGVQELLERKRVIARENGKLGGRPKKTHVETDMETEEKPTLVSELTDVGTEIGTNVGANIQNRKKERKEERNIGGETTTVDSTPGEDVPPPPPVFSSPSRPRIADNHPAADPRAWQFIVACLQVNPVWSKTMPTAQEQGIALEAWESCKGSVTPKDIRLLQAYYASDLDSDRKGKPFWRPDSRSRFWEKFNDVLTHATRWAKETRWKPKTQQATKSKDEPTDAVSAENSLSIEEALKALHDPNWNPNENMHEKK